VYEAGPGLGPAFCTRSPLPAVSPGNFRVTASCRPVNNAVFLPLKEKRNGPMLAVNEIGRSWLRGPARALIA